MRAAVERRQACALRKERAPRRKMRRWLPCVCRRSASFNFFFVARVERSETRERQSSQTFVPGFRCAQSGLQGETGITEERKSGPTPALSLDRTGFAIDLTVFCWRALRFLSRATENSGAETRRGSVGVWHESPTQQLAQRTPSPQRGEGWGEGVRTLQIVLRVPNPLILSFSPAGRRDAAFRQLFPSRARTMRVIPPAPAAPPGSRYATTPKSCRGTPCRNRAPCAPCRFSRQARRARRLPWHAPR
jgi:hypothetical protein